MNKLNKCIAALIMAVVVLSFEMATFAARTVTVDIPVKSTVTGVISDIPETFTFEMKADNTDNPMPEGSTSGVKTIQITGSGESAFSGISYSRVGIYTYKICQLKGSNALCTYDETVYFLTVSVVNSGDDLIAIPFMTRNDSEFKWEKADFVNQYNEEGGSLTVVKSVNRGSVSPGENLIYTLTVKNTKAIELVGIRVRDYIPEYTSFFSVNDDYGEHGNIGGKDHVTWFIPSIAPGESYVFSFTVSVDESLPEERSVYNTAMFSVTGSSTPPSVNMPEDPGTPTNDVETPRPSLPPSTGDSSNFDLHIALLVVAFSGLFCCLLIKKFKDRKKFN